MVCLLAGVLFGCSESGPVDPYECTERFGESCWTHLGLDEQWIYALAETEWGVFAGTENSGVLRLNPSSGQWESLGLDHEIVSSLLFVPGSTKRLLAGILPRGGRPPGAEQTAAAVFASADRGRSWLPWDGGLAARHDNRAWAFSLARDPTDQSRLFMGLSYPIMRSSNAGTSWEYVWGNDDVFGNGIRSIVISSRQDGRAWAAGRTGFFAAAVLRSDDNGASWAYIDPLPGDENEVTALVLDPRQPDGIWAAMGAGLGGVLYSGDAGTTWQWVFRIWGKGVVGDLTLVNGILYAMALENVRPPPDGQGPSLSDLGFYRSSDWGATWDTLPVPPGASGGFRIAPGRAGGLFIGTAGGGVWHVTP